MMQQYVVSVAVPCPLRQTFDYYHHSKIAPGCRVEISFANRTVIGVVTRCQLATDEPSRTLKPLNQCIDETPLLDDHSLQLLNWVSRYYHHPVGECVQAFLPKQLRQGYPAQAHQENYWYCLQNDFQPKGHKQQQLLDLLKNGTFSESQLRRRLGNVKSSLESLQKAGVITAEKHDKLPFDTIPEPVSVTLSDEQRDAVKAVDAATGRFAAFCLFGITGSGKTEVYLELARRQVGQGRQVLILIPEISLSSEFVRRFREGCQSRIVLMHSSVSDSERRQAWLLARNGSADIVIGTRSAVFCPLLNPGLVIIDEEHDASYKQQDGLRYHARSVALVRAQQQQIPIVMGSATPSVETLYQVELERHQQLDLTRRPGKAELPQVRMIDNQPKGRFSALSQELIETIKKHLNAGNQVMLFINRRGYAPVLMCHECQWQAQCDHCDARMVWHRERGILFCHHCGVYRHQPKTCPACQHPELKSHGAGTEKIESQLAELFSDTPVIRVDRDTTQRKQAFAEIITQVRSAQPLILVGTQMLAKGHDFANVTLVGVLDADQGLFSADFRASEALAQLITQVTGRAGRGDKAGEVCIQTRQPQHAFWQQLLKTGYLATARSLLAERQEMQLPPVVHWAILRCEDRNRERVFDFLEKVVALTSQQADPQVIVLGPIPSIMEKKAGRFRAQILFSAEKRRFLHQFLDFYLPPISQLPGAGRLRWSLDVDPTEIG